MVSGDSPHYTSCWLGGKRLQPICEQIPMSHDKEAISRAMAARRGDVFRQSGLGHKCHILSVLDGSSFQLRLPQHHQSPSEVHLCFPFSSRACMHARRALTEPELIGFGQQRSEEEEPVLPVMKMLAVPLGELLSSRADEP